MKYLKFFWYKKGIEMLLVYMLKNWFKNNSKMIKFEFFIEILIAFLLWLKNIVILIFLNILNSS